jgi:hypothetical protein
MSMRLHYLNMKKLSFLRLAGVLVEGDAGSRKRLGAMGNRWWE